MLWGEDTACKAKGSPASDFAQAGISPDPLLPLSAVHGAKQGHRPLCRGRSITAKAGSGGGQAGWAAAAWSPHATTHEESWKDLAARAWGSHREGHCSCWHLQAPPGTGGKRRRVWNRACKTPLGDMRDPAKTGLSAGPSRGFYVQSLGWLFYHVLDLPLYPLLRIESHQKQFLKSFKPLGIYFKRFKITIVYLNYFYSMPHTVTAQMKKHWEWVYEASSILKMPNTILSPWKIPLSSMRLCIVTLCVLKHVLKFKKVSGLTAMFSWAAKNHPQLSRGMQL